MALARNPEIDVTLLGHCYPSRPLQENQGNCGICKEAVFAEPLIAPVEGKHWTEALGKRVNRRVYHHSCFHKPAPTH